MKGSSTLVVLLLVGVAAYLVLDAMKRRPSNGNVETRAAGTNDPYQTQINALAGSITSLAGTVGNVAGKSTGTAVAGAQGGLAYGLGTPYVNKADLEALVSNAYYNGLAAGGTSGADAGGAAGGGVGAFIGSAPSAAIQGIVASQRAAAKSPLNPNTLYEVPLFGAAARLQDAGVIPLWTGSGFKWGNN